MLRFLKIFALIAATLGGLATFLFYAPKIVSDSIPYFVNAFLSPPPKQNEPPKSDPNRDDAQKGRQSYAQPIDDRFVLPAGVTTQEFTQCLSKSALVDGRDFTIREVSSVYRVLIPNIPGTAIASGYDDCWERLRR